MSRTRLYLLLAIWLGVTASHGFWSLLFATNGTTASNWPFAISLFVAITALNMTVLRVLTPGCSLRPTLSILTLVAAIASWFIDSYGVAIDSEMLRNVMQTDTAEAAAFMGWSLLWRMVWQAGPPLLVIWNAKLPASSGWLSFRNYLLGSGVSLIVLLAVALPQYVSYASFFRNQRAAELLIVPGNVIRAAGKLMLRTLEADTPFVVVGADATRNVMAHAKPLLTVLIVGETARAANFSLNGYARPTNPLLTQRNVLYFSNVHSCGTATAISLPCMFSDLPRREFDLSAARHRDTVLDILQRAGLSTIWVDNQSGCKGVCDRIPSEHADQYSATPCSNSECLDEVLLQVLDRKLTTLTHDSLLVLHPMGSHGPSYHRRVPPTHILFKPTCATERIETCTREEIVNAYDNSIAYTDYVLAGLIDRLKQQQDRFDSVLIYVSDHGESLGENGLYLHGEPYSIAPDYQKHVPMLMWFSADASSRLGIDLQCLRAQQSQALSHDNIAHTLLGLNDVKTSVYRPELDLFYGCHDPYGLSRD